MSDRASWPEAWCPTCRVAPGARCRNPNAQGRREPLSGESVWQELEARERFLTDALEPLISEYDDIIIDTPPNLGLLTVNALVVAELVVAPVRAEDDASLHGIRERRQTLHKLTDRLSARAPVLMPVLTRWQPLRISSRLIEQAPVVESLRPAVRVPARHHHT